MDGRKKRLKMLKRENRKVEEIRVNRMRGMVKAIGIDWREIFFSQAEDKDE